MAYYCPSFDHRFPDGRLKCLPFCGIVETDGITGAEENRMKKAVRIFPALLLFLALVLTGCDGASSTDTAATLKTPGYTEEMQKQTAAKNPDGLLTISDIPAYDGTAYTVINDNRPNFSSSDLTTKPFETYSDLDVLGRCGTAYANICREIMPTEERGSIESVRPSGWQSKRYDIVDGGSLYNRCHLIGFQLAGENANEKNLITGTRYMNVDGMLPFENLVADYVKETDNHVLYRVTPLFHEDELVARGVFMEAESVEDKGEGVSFHVFCYNVQPGISIDYSDGSSERSSGGQDKKENSYIGNSNTMKFHRPSCTSVDTIKAGNMVMFTSRSKAVKAGYEPCGRCRP